MCKILLDYYNVDGWRVGDVVEITNPTQLIKEGKVVMLNEKGEEVAPSWVSLKCPICVFEGKTPFDLAHHILDTHTKSEETPREEQKPSSEDIKKKRLAALEKARAIRKLKKLEENIKKKEQDRDASLKEAIEATKLT
jgi:hypothetical protein